MQRLPRPSAAPPGFSEFLETLETGNILDVWNQAFAMDFGRYRSELNRISAENLSSVRDARLTVGFADFAAWYRTDDDEMIYPIDDDDYFDPGLARTAPNAADETAVVFWPHVVYTYDDLGSPVLLTRPVRHLLTNNWGVRKSFLKLRFTEDEARRVLMDHAYAARGISSALGLRLPASDEKWWDVELESERAAFLAKSFGLSLIHVGSLLRLRLANQGASLTDLRVGESAEIPPEMMWAEPWIRQAERVFRALRD